MVADAGLHGAGDRPPRDRRAATSRCRSWRRPLAVGRRCDAGPLVVVAPATSAAPPSSSATPTGPPPWRARRSRSPPRSATPSTRTPRARTRWPPRRSRSAETTRRRPRRPRAPCSLAARGSSPTELAHSWVVQGEVALAAGDLPLAARSTREAEALLAASTAPLHLSRRARELRAGLGTLGPAPGAPAVPVGELTDREVAVLRRLAGTASAREIAADLHVSHNTVKTQVRSIYRKLGVATRDEAVERGQGARHPVALPGRRRLSRLSPPRPPSARPGRLAEADPVVQAAQRGRRPPVPLAEQRHQGRHQQRADDGGVDQHRQGRAHAELLDEQHPGGGEGADRDREQQRRGGHDAAGALEAQRHRVLRLGPRVVRLLDARQQEHRVVGGQAERQRAEQDRLGQVQGADAVVAEQALQAAVLEDPHQDAERGRQGQQVHDHGLDRQQHRPGHDEQGDDRHHRDHQDRPRQVRRDAVLLVHEARGEPADQDRVRRRRRADVVDQRLAGVGERRGVASRCRSARCPRRRRRAGRRRSPSGRPSGPARRPRASPWPRGCRGP